MSILTYIPNETKIVHVTKIDFMKNTIPKKVHLVQYDSVIPIVAVDLYSNDAIYTLNNDPNLSMRLRWGKKLTRPTVIKDILGCNATRNRVYFSVDSDMTNEAGIFNPILELVETIDNKEQSLGSSQLIFEVDPNPIIE